MGILVKNEFYDLVSDFNVPGQFEIQVIEYQQGWFSSTADVQYTIKADNGSNLDATPMPPFQFVLREKIHHGPIIYLPSDKNKKLRFAQAVFESKFNDTQYPLTAQTTIQLDGKMSTSIQAEKVSNSIEQMEGTSFVFQKIDGKFDISPKQKNAEGKLKLGTIDLLLNKSQLRIQNLDLDYKLEKSEDEIWAGNRNITMGSLFLDTPDNQQIILHGFLFDLYNDIESEKMRAGINFKLSSVQINGKNYGEQNVKLSVNDLNLKSVSDIQKHSQSIKHQNIPMPILITQFYQLTMNLLGNGLTFDLSQFDLNTSWGEVRAKVNLILHPANQTVYSPLQLLDQLSATAYFQLPQTLFEELVQYYHLPKEGETEIDAKKIASDKIKEWTNAGWITPKNKNIKLKVKYEKKELFINDKLVPIDNTPLFTGKIIPEILAMNFLH